MSIRNKRPHVHSYADMGHEVIDGNTLTVWKCRNCSDKKFTPAGTVIRTFP